DRYIPDTVVGDPQRIRQVLVNLIGNAIKFTQLGEVVLGVKATPRTAENKSELELNFTVRDSGIGISKEKQELIFNAFTQADGSTTRQYGGTGLGLTISKRLVEMMGGRIWVESEAGKGSVFHFTVRFDVVAARKPQGAGHVVDLVDMPALVVDDNATNRRVLHDVLTR